MVRRTLGAVPALAALVLGSGCQLVLDFSPLADGGGGPARYCEVAEPNDDVTAAMPMGSALDASVCGSGDRDFYGFSVDGSQDVVALVTFAAGANDLEMQLWSVADASVIEISTGIDGDERIEQSMEQGDRLAAGSYAIEIFGRAESASNDYHVSLSLDAAGPAADAGAI